MYGGQLGIKSNAIVSDPEQLANNTLGGYTMRLTRHAEARVRARGVNIRSLELIKRFGHHKRSVAGAKVRIANKRERKKILKVVRITIMACEMQNAKRKELKQWKAVRRNFERSDPLYFVEASCGSVITTGRRTRRIRRR